MHRPEYHSAPRFLRDPRNGYLGGVCEGVARGLRVPALLVRIAAVVAALTATTPTVIAYAAAWLLMDSREEYGLD
ncbi:MAG: PspC domain-containing protein [Pseudomonadales bacterium]|jgi:phage shock protein PspC (stress-responsive transcriptional regulator)|nr:PspC domain-containing protein [Pseudomonadales bacterium]